MFSKPKTRTIYSVIRGPLNLDEGPHGGSMCEKHANTMSILVDVRFQQGGDKMKQTQMETNYFHRLIQALMNEME